MCSNSCNCKKIIYKRQILNLKYGTVMNTKRKFLTPLFFNQRNVRENLLYFIINITNIDLSKDVQSLTFVLDSHNPDRLIPTSRMGIFNLSINT